MCVEGCMSTYDIVRSMRLWKFMRYYLGWDSHALSKGDELRFKRQKSVKSPLRTMSLLSTVQHIYRSINVLLISTTSRLEKDAAQVSNADRPEQCNWSQLSRCARHVASEHKQALLDRAAKPVPVALFAPARISFPAHPVPVSHTLSTLHRAQHVSSSSLSDQT